MLKLLRRLLNMDLFRSILLLFCVYTVSACSPSSSKSISDPEPADTTAPVIIAIFPEGDETGFEVDSRIRIEFSELVSEASITDKKTINLYSETVEGEETILYEIESKVEIATEINRGEKLNEATGINSSADVSVLYVTPSEGRFALNSRYVISVESTLHDLVEDDVDTSVDEKNYFDGPRAISFSTPGGKWKNLGVTQELVKNGDNAKELSKPITLPVTASNDLGDLFYARVSDNSNLYVSKFSHNSNNWMNGNEEVADSCITWTETTLGQECVNSTLVNDGDGGGVISSVKLSVSNDFAILTWLRSSTVDRSKSLWMSIYKDGVWSDAENVNLVFSDDLSSDDINVNMHSVSVNKERVLIVWRSIDLVPIIVDGKLVIVGGEVQKEEREIVRTVSFEVNEAISSLKNYIPTIIINKSADPNINSQEAVRNVEAVWLNDLKGVVLWTQYVDNSDDDNENPIYHIYEKELSVEVVVRQDGTISKQYNWGIERLVDSYEFSSDQTEQNHVVSFKPLVDSKGDLSLLWKKFDGRLDNLWFAKRVQGVWSTPEKLENNQAGSVIEYVAVFNSIDELMIAWTQQNREGDLVVYYKSRHSGTSEEVNEELYSSDFVRGLQIVSDFQGNGHIFWVEAENTIDVISTMFFSKISESWSEVSQLTSESLGGDIKEINLSTLYKDGRVLMLTNEVGYDKQVINQQIFE